MNKYCNDPFNRSRLKTIEVVIGGLGFGGENHIRLQSMTTTDTMDTQKSIEQSVRMIEAGCELVRLTAPSKNEAQNLQNIQDGLRALGYQTPLVADIHFTPNAAEVAAGIVAKVRVNPGNYADKKKFEEHLYTDESYQEELDRIEEKFTPLVSLCKANGTAMRIGTNHGSLSDRILSRYGDTPEGMVESALEFIRICEKNDYHQIVVSMKASNTLVMVQAYRLLCAKMLENGRCYPLHLGVTEAGDGEDGRIKSAVGIGALLEDGIGDTIRVSLTEEPEFEIPVARKLAEKYSQQKVTTRIDTNSHLPYSPFAYQRRTSYSLHNIGDHHVPVVIANLSEKTELKPAHFFGFGYAYSIELDKWNIMDQAADYVYIGSNPLPFKTPGTLGIMVDYPLWEQEYKDQPEFFPVSPILLDISKTYFYRPPGEFEITEEMKSAKNAVFIIRTQYENKTQVFRNILCELTNNNIKNPVILEFDYTVADEETFQIHSASDAGSILIDGFGDGIWINANQALRTINSTSFGILQATRTRISKTEYISCPSCGRTLFDLQETTGKIRERTSHLKGIKIGIMGCIVNGPGEMADADYGYVGTGPGKIHLYKEKTVVRKNVPEEDAVDALIELIRENGDWIDAPNHN